MQTEAIFENIASRIKFEITNAEKSIFIAVAWFTNRNLFDVLVDKAKAGCSVSLIISNDKINLNSSIDFELLNTKNSKVYWIGSADTELMHNKFCVIDYGTVINGSYNWSYRAESNFENVIITQEDTALAEQFILEFNNIRKQYYPEKNKEDEIFPIDKIIKRLEILKNYILLEDIEELNKGIEKLSKYNFNTDLQRIIQDIVHEDFFRAVNHIRTFITKNQQLSIWKDPEVLALKLEIKNLENKLYAYDNEKIELERILSKFQHRHALELGDIILEILRLRKLIFKDDEEKYQEAEKDEKQYKKQVTEEEEKEVYNLTAEQEKELKKKFRKATLFCHPDKVSNEYKKEAEIMFIELKKAYDTNDLKTVSEIVRQLEKGDFFKPKSETVSEKNALKIEIKKLRRQIKILENEIIEMKTSDTFNTVNEIEDWNKYFTEIKSKLIQELEILKKPIYIKTQQTNQN